MMNMAKSISCLLGTEAPREKYNMRLPKTIEELDIRLEQVITAINDNGVRVKAKES